MQRKAAGDFNLSGLKTSCPAGSTNFPSRTVLCSRTIPQGAQAHLISWMGNVIDIGNNNQVYFSIQRNGQSIQAGLDRIPGEQFQYQPQLPLNFMVAPGLIEIVAYNISGMSATIEPSAVAGVAVNCQASLQGELLSEKGGY